MQGFSCSFSLKTDMGHLANGHLSKKLEFVKEAYNMNVGKWAEFEHIETK